MSVQQAHKQGVEHLVTEELKSRAEARRLSDTSMHGSGNNWAAGGSKNHYSGWSNMKV